MPATEIQQEDKTAARLGLSRSAPIFDRSKAQKLTTPKAIPIKPHLGAALTAPGSQLPMESKYIVAITIENSWLVARKGTEIRVMFLDGEEITGTLHEVRQYNFVCGDILVMKNAVKYVAGVAAVVLNKISVVAQ
jgi:hypothetical protein